MFLLNPPTVRPLEIFTSMPDKYRRTGERSLWADVNQGGRLADSFLEGPVFDAQGNLYVTDIPFGRVFRIDPRGEWDLVAQWDGEPNGMKFLNADQLLITDYRNGLVFAAQPKQPLNIGPTRLVVNWGGKWNQRWIRRRTARLERCGRRRVAGAGVAGALALTRQAGHRSAPGGHQDARHDQRGRVLLEPFDGRRHQFHCRDFVFAFDDFIGAARAVPEVVAIETFLGRVDVRLNVIARDMAHYQEVYRARILALPHIAEVDALMLISTIKNSEGLPL